MRVIDSKQEQKYIKAKKRVDELKGFYWHAFSNIAVMPLLVFINYKTSWSFQWFWFPVIGMSISIIIHAFIVFKYTGDWEERKIKELMDKDKY